MKTIIFALLLTLGTSVAADPYNMYRVQGNAEEMRRIEEMQILREMNERQRRADRQQQEQQRQYMVPYQMQCRPFTNHWDKVSVNMGRASAGLSVCP
jgi:hypothetical protein